MHLSKTNLINIISNSFGEIKETRIDLDYPIADDLMAAFAIFSLKAPPLLEFAQIFRNEQQVITQNMKNLFGVDHVPLISDLCKRLDELNPLHIRDAFKKVFAELQRGNVLEDFRFIDHHVMLSINRMEFLSSKQVHFPNCHNKHHRDGSVTSVYQMVCAALVHPYLKGVFPVFPEAIAKEDEATKNHSDQNAIRRLIDDFRQEFPHLKTIVVQDGLTSNASYITYLERLDLRYILGAKQGDRKFIQEYMNNSKEMQEVEIKHADGPHYRFRYHNNVPLNASNPDVRINFLDCLETKAGTKKRPTPKTLRFSWVTDLLVEDANLMEIMRAGRVKWNIDSETFNTLKSEEDHFEHHLGLSNMHLPTVFCSLLMLAFLVDQVEQRCDGLFRDALEKMGRPKYFRSKVSSMFMSYDLDSWEFLYTAITKGYKGTISWID